MLKDPIQNFRRKYAECLVIAEIIARGTGPIKFLKAGQKDNPVIFDMCFFPEIGMPPIWHDDLIVRARGFALTPPSQRADDFEREYAEARRAVLNRSRNLFREATIAAARIHEPLARRIRQEEMESLYANFEYSDYVLSRWPESKKSKPYFSLGQFNITGRTDCPSEDSLDTLVAQLSAKLTRKGFEGTLQEQMETMEKVLYLTKDQVVPLYREIMKKMEARTNELLGSGGFPLEIIVEPLPETELKTGYMAYEGGGRALTYIRPSSTTTAQQTCFNAAHEMTHLWDASLSERYFLRTHDLFGAMETMCTSTVCRAEGLGEHGAQIYSEVVQEQFKDAPWMLEILQLHAKLKFQVIHYACKVIHEETSKPFDPVQIQARLKTFYLKYGFDEQKAETLSKWPNAPDRENKNAFYSPFYGIGRDLVKTAFSAFPDFETALKQYSKVTREYGPITVRSLKQAMLS